MVKGSFLLIMFTALVAGSNGAMQEFANRQWRPPEGSNQVVCRSIDARNTVDMLRKMQNCTIIVGCLQMVLINNVPIDINDISFPLLREVTDYIYVYQVKGLRSLSKLFPNLEVIGGRELLWNYALVIDQVSQLEEVGLYNLKTIRNGLVRIDNNPEACYLKAINWDKITSRSGNSIIQNAACEHQDPCAHCPGGHCWNKKTCQILPPSEEETENCDAKCLTCSISNSTSCYKCRYYSGEHSCVAACIGDRVILQILNTSYCLTIQQCLALYGLVDGGVCFIYCPTPESRKTYDIKGLLPFIKDRCSTVCPSLMINSLGDLQKAVNCKEIKGSLQIRLYGEYEVVTMEDLRRNLGSVEVIRDYLKIFSTNVITSFTFLVNLKLIQGKHLYMSTYSIAIHDMINLRHLFNDKGTRNLKIESGDILAFDNPKLCMEEIKKLHGNVKNKIPKAEQIAYTSNGYSAMCHKKEIKPSHLDIKYDNITITFLRVTPSYQRKRYRIHLLQSDQKTPEEFFKACQKKGWRTLAINDVDKQNLNITFKISGLRALAYYTYYIESVSMYDNHTHITDDKIDKSHSHIITFQTAPKCITPPSLVNISSLEPNTLYVQWKDNIIQEHLVHFYIFQLELIKDTLNIYDNINFCRRPSTKHYINTKLHSEYQSFRKKHCAECASDRGNVEFDVETIVDSPDPDNNPERFIESKNVYKSLNYTDKRLFYRTVVNAPINNVTVKSLFDYGYYKINIYACSLTNCSKATTGAKRIMQSVNADNIDVNGYVSENKKLNLVWAEPTAPNGVIISYLVELLQTGTGASEPTNSYAPLRFCITRGDHQLNNYTFVIPHDSGVKYNVRIAATSLAGVGRFSNYTFSGPSAPHHVVLWAISFVILASLCGLAFLYARRRRQRMAQSEFRNPLIRTSSEIN